jgi:hypothetical protein
LVGEIVDREQRGGFREIGVVLPARPKKRRDESGMPIMEVEDVGAEADGLRRANGGLGGIEEADVAVSVGPGLGSVEGVPDFEHPFIPDRTRSARAARSKRKPRQSEGDAASRQRCSSTDPSTRVRFRRVPLRTFVWWGSATGDVETEFRRRRREGAPHVAESHQGLGGRRLRT